MPMPEAGDHQELAAFSAKAPCPEVVQSSVGSLDEGRACRILCWVAQYTTTHSLQVSAMCNVHACLLRTESSAYQRRSRRGWLALKGSSAADSCGPVQPRNSARTTSGQSSCHYCAVARQKDTHRHELFPYPAWLVVGVCEASC